MLNHKTISNDDNEKIFVETYTPANPKSTIIFCHGVTGCRKGRTVDDDYFQTFATRLCDDNYKVVLFDFSGHGDSEGESQDVCLSKSVSELEKVFESEVETENVDFLAFSYGATVLCGFLEKHKNIRPDHIAMISPGLDLLNGCFLNSNNLFGKDVAKAYLSGEMKEKGYATIGAKNFKLGINFIEELKSFKPDYLAKINSKLLILSGANDVIIDTKYNHDFCEKHNIKNIDYNASHSLFEEIDKAFDDIKGFFDS